MSLLEEKYDEKLLAYLNVRTAESVQAIPNQNKFTFIAKMDRVPQAWSLDEKGHLIQYGEFEERVMSVNHSPGGDSSVIGMDFNGNEKQQLFLLDPLSLEVETLVNEPDYFHHFGGWSQDGNYIAFSSNRRHPGYFDVFIQNVKTKEIKKVLENDGNCTPLSWFPDGKNILISTPVTHLDQAIYILNIESGHKTKVGKSGILASYRSIVLSKSGKEVFLLTDLGEETIYVCQISLEKPDHLEKLFHIPKWDVEGLTLSPCENCLAFTVNEGGISKLYIYNLTTQISREIKVAKEGVINSISWLNDEQFIFILKSPTMHGDIWSYSLSTNRLERLTYICRSKEIEDQWVEPVLCSFDSFDGLNVPYFLYEKEGIKNKPVVIYVHGGPASQIRAEYNPVIQYLVNEGVAVAAPNVRGSRGYGRTYMKLDEVRKRMDSVQDLAWLVKDLVRSHGINREKIGIMGRSYGGFMVLAALSHYPNLWAAGVNIVGISHFKTFLQNTGEWRRLLREFEYGSLENDKEFFEKIAPLNHSHKIKAPLLVFHGRHDSRVPISEAEQLVKDMKVQGQVVDLIVFENEGHQTVKIENHFKMNSKIAEFMKNHLQKD